VEPIASSGAGASIRAGALGPSELSSLLRDGRVLRAEVVSPQTDGTLLLSIARHMVPAESDLRLDPGAQLLVRVEEGRDGLVLQILAPPTESEEALVGALRARVGRQAPLGELLGELARILTTPRGAGTDGQGAPAWSVPLAALLRGPEPGGEGLRGWLAALGLGHEAGVGALATERPGRSRLEEPRGSLKGLLLAAEADLGRGPESHEGLRQAIARALTGLETEQLLHLARERGSDPAVLAFPVPDGEGWATARLRVPPRARDQGSGGAPSDGIGRVTLGVELSRLGPVRVDLVLGPSVLSARFLVTSEEVARSLRERLDELDARLGGGARRVDVRVRVGTPLEARRGFSPGDIRYLQDHPLMDVSG